MKYLRNVWYVAAWDTEVPAGRPFGRMLLGEPVVFFRDASGAVHALADQCPHRFAPLSKGRVNDDGLQCGYHGLRFGGGGACIHNPQGDGKIPRAAKVRSYPVVERYSLIWIWMGDPMRANADSIPELQSMDPASRWVGKEYLLARADYQLETDNILDLSHIEFLHPGTLGSEAVKDAEVEVIVEDRTVYSRRLTRNERLTSSLEARYGIPPGQIVDRWLDTRWSAPAVMELKVGIAPAGADDPRKAGRQAPFIHAFTPETEKTAHYWFGTSYSKRMGEEGRRRAESDAKYYREPFEQEDLPMLEAQQRAMGERTFWQMKPLVLAGDLAGIRVRRLLEGLIQAEEADAASPMPPA